MAAASGSRGQAAPACRSRDGHRAGRHHHSGPRPRAPARAVAPSITPPVPAGGQAGTAAPGPARPGVPRHRAAGGAGGRGDADAGQARHDQQPTGGPPDTGQPPGGEEIAAADPDNAAGHHPPAGSGPAGQHADGPAHRAIGRRPQDAGHQAAPGQQDRRQALPRHETEHAALLADILDVLHGSSPAATEQSSLPPAEELSPGELRVLRYLPTNLSRPEIAGELSVSPSTVSTHVRSIYAKLQVRDRSSAVQRARELRLLAAGRTR
jgi:DNA-binding CsgD family transcriptional regulator